MASVILASVAFSVGSAFMKASQDFTRLLPSVVVLASFAVGTVLLTHAVNHSTLSTTYALGLGLEAVITLTVGLAVLGERLTPRQAGGLCLILLGVVAIRA